MGFYDTKKWIRLRESVLVAAEYKDQLALREGRMLPAQTVHHIFPRDKYPEYELQRWNLIAVSMETHNLLHNRLDRGLSPLGWDLLVETAQRHGIPISRLFLVVGLPGSGKTTFVRRHLHNGLCYDMDHLAAAFRLRHAHEEKNEQARRLAASLLYGFAENAKRFSGLSFIIRTSPSVEEIMEIRPDAVFICTRSFNIQNRKDYQRLTKATEEEYQENLKEIKAWCVDNHIDVTEVS